MFVIRPASWPHDASRVRGLFRAYADDLGVDLCFQGFEAELAELPGKYAPPEGNLWLAEIEGRAVGCVAIRAHAPGVAEMKRLFVLNDARGHNLGRRLAETSLTGARAQGYTEIVLDTLDRLVAARLIYAKLQFIEVQAYNDNPLAGVVFLKRKL